MRFGEFEKKVRAGRDLFLSENSGRWPHYPINGEDLCLLSSVAGKVGLPQNHESIHVVGDFCRLSNPAGEMIFLDARHREIYAETTVEAVITAQAA